MAIHVYSTTVVINTCVQITAQDIAVCIEPNSTVVYFT